MPLNMQAKLLRVLQEKKVRRIGGHEEIPVCCRIISATNRDIEEAIKDNILRQDIYYRLASIVIELPPLRERKGDGPLLIRYFLERCHKLYGTRLQEIDPAVHEVLQKYSWPGNVREMEHMVENMVILAGKEETVLTTRHLPANFSQTLEKIKKTKVPDIDLNTVIDDYERSLILKALNGHDFNMAATARSLNIQRSVLYSKMKRLGIEKE